jgi:patatin-like phospholipase/acyl hydrolase
MVTNVKLITRYIESQTGVINIFFVQAKLNDLKNARLADVCIGTSAAPTFLPAHYFETQDAEGNTRSFDLIDGGVAANNPVSS